MNPALLNKIPEEVREHVKMLLSVTPNVRPDADQMTKVCILFVLVLEMFSGFRLKTYFLFIYFFLLV